MHFGGDSLWHNSLVEFLGSCDFGGHYESRSNMKGRNASQEEWFQWMRQILLVGNFGFRVCAM